MRRLRKAEDSRRAFCQRASLPSPGSIFQEEQILAYTITSAQPSPASKIFTALPTAVCPLRGRSLPQTSLAPGPTPSRSHDPGHSLAPGRTFPPARSTGSDHDRILASRQSPHRGPDRLHGAFPLQPRRVLGPCPSHALRLAALFHSFPAYKPPPTNLFAAPTAPIK